MCESVLRTGGRLGLLVGLLVHQWVSNGFGVPDTGLGPGTPWWSNRQSLRSHGACNLEGSGQPVSVCRTPPAWLGPRSSSVQLHLLIAGLTVLSRLLSSASLTS